MDDNRWEVIITVNNPGDMAEVYLTLTEVLEHNSIRVEDHPLPIASLNPQQQQGGR